MAGKKGYKRPEVKKIGLTPEDAVLTNCKSLTGGIASNKRCKGPSSCNNGNLGGS